MDRSVAPATRAASAVIALFAALLAALAAFANLLIPAEVLSVCSDSFTDYTVFLWRGAGFTLAATSLWLIGRVLGSGERQIRLFSIVLLFVIALAAGATWWFATLEWSVPDQPGPSCPEGREGAGMTAAVFSAVAPLLAVVVAEASTWPSRMPWWARMAIGFAGGLLLTAALVLVVG